MEYLILIFVISIAILMLIGFFDSKTSLFWLKKKKTRAKSFLIYFPVLFILLVVLGSVIPEDEMARIEAEEAKRKSLKEAKKEEKKRLKEKDEQTKTTKSLSKIEVHTLVVGLVKEQLVSPSTAKIKYNPDNIYEVNDTIFLVKGYVDSENSFGAMIRTNFSCQINYFPSTDMYTYENLVFE